MSENIVPDISKIKTFYINLKKDVNKNKNFIKNDIIKFQRFPAIYAKKYKDNELFLKKISLSTQSKIHFNSRNTHEEINSFGAIGCSLSHYHIWKSFLDEKLDEEYLKLFNEDPENDKTELDNISFSKNGNDVDDEYLLIFEDDININDIEKFKDQIENDIKELMKFNIIWDILLIKHLSSRDSENLIVKEDFSPVNNQPLFTGLKQSKCTWNYCKINSFFGMQCYIIKKSAIKKIIESNYFFPIECHIDAFLGLLSQKKNIINIVSSDNKYIYHNDSNFISTTNIFHSNPNIEYNLIYNLIYFLTIFILTCIVIYLLITKK